MNSPLVVIVGPTASGKTAAAIELAEQFDGEIICADSRTVYKGMDIGTAKPTPAEQAMIPHHLLDVVSPDERFTASDFKKLANKAIADISARGKLPILVGGSGLYIDAVLYDFEFAGPEAARNEQNVRHAHSDVPRKRAELRPRTLIIGMATQREHLRPKLEARVDAMIAAGLVDEVASIQQKYPSSKALDAPGYKAFREYLEGAISLDEAKTLFVTNDYQLARRQMTWFKRNNSIHWCTDIGEIVAITTTFLNKIN